MLHFAVLSTASLPVMVIELRFISPEPRASSGSRIPKIRYFRDLLCESEKLNVNRKEEMMSSWFLMIAVRQKRKAIFADECKQQLNSCDTMSFVDRKYEFYSVFIVRAIGVTSGMMQASRIFRKF